MIRESEKKLIAPCGIYCGQCNDYLAYAKGDPEAMTKAIAEISKVLHRNVSPDEVRCLGCWGEVHTAHSACIGCEVRRCAEGKGILTCAVCDEFLCEKLDRRIRKNDKKQRDNLYRIREVGLEAWLDEIKSSPGV